MYFEQQFETTYYIISWMPIHYYTRNIWSSRPANSPQKEIVISPKNTLVSSYFLTLICQFFVSLGVDRASHILKSQSRDIKKQVAGSVYKKMGRDARYLWQGSYLVCNWLNWTSDRQQFHSQFRTIFLAWLNEDNQPVCPQITRPNSVWVLSSILAHRNRQTGGHCV